MKQFLLIIVLIAFVQFGCTQNKIPLSIKVTYVDCSIETVISIPCNLFDIQFEQVKKYGEIKNSELKKASAFLKKFVKINWNSIDVRGKIEFELAGQRYKYCFDEFGKFTDGVAFYENVQLFKLIKKTFPNFCT